MKKGDIYQRLLELVSECTEIPKEQIVSDCRIAEVVDARCVFVYWLKQAGFSARLIMQLCGFKSKSTICYHSSIYNERIKNNKFFRNQALYIGKQVVCNGLVSGQ